VEKMQPDNQLTHKHSGLLIAQGMNDTCVSRLNGVRFNLYLRP
jgi:hypothetical protein